MTKDFGADNGVLCEVLGRAATDHEEARLRAVHLDFGEFEEVGHRVDAHVRLAGLLAEPLVLTDAEASRAVAEGGAENRHAAFVAGLDKAFFLHAMTIGQPFADLIEELAAAVGTTLQGVSHVAGGLVAGLQFFFIDEGIVDTVDVEFTQLGVGDDILFCANVVLVAEGFEEVHVDDAGTRADHSVNHFVSNHLHIHLHAASGRSGTSDGEDVGTVLLRNHLAKDVGSASGVARSERHLAHSVDEFGRVVLLNVDMFDNVFQ